MTLAGSLVMKMIKAFGPVVLALLLSCPVTQAQLSVSINVPDLHSGKIGLGIDGITGSPDILLKYFFNNQLAGQLILGASYDIPGGSAPTGLTKVNGLTLRGGISILYHLNQEPLTPYVGGEAIFQRATSSGFFAVEPDPKNTLFVRIVFGGEYFLSPHFSLGIRQSVGGEVRLSRTFPSEEQEILLSTGTVFTGRYYFN
jgi:hypothetical protein